MKSFYATSFIISLLIISSCKNKEMTLAQKSTANPLLSEFTTPYGVPPFDLIKGEHYKPALEAAKVEHKSEIDSIANNTAAPEFSNTIEALDKAGYALSRVSSIFFNMTSANTNETLEKISEEMAPILSKHYDYISLNEKLFARVKAVWEAKDKLNLNEEQSELLDKTYKSSMAPRTNTAASPSSFVARLAQGATEAGQSLAANCDDDTAIGVCQFEMRAGDEIAVVKTMRALNGLSLQHQHSV